MLNLRRFFRVLRRTGLFNMFMGFIICYLVSGLLLFLIEPDVHSFGDGLWFSFVSFSTIGFGDITAGTIPGRIIVIFITVYAMIVLAMVPGVVVSYYNEYLRAKENDTISTFLEKLENLPDLPKSELAEISDRVKQFKAKRKKH